MYQIKQRTFWLHNKYLPLIYTNYHWYGSDFQDFSEYFKLLNISEDSDQYTARESFLKLAKIYHPDSNHPEANAETFQKIENAYKKVLEKFSQERRNFNDCEGEYGLYYKEKETEVKSQSVYDIKHTAPQHRQYLSFEGIGIGTPSQREKQFTKYKAMRAAENIIDYKVQKLNEESKDSALVAKDIKKIKNIQTRYGVDRLIEDKIQESIARGDFENLPNAGKPLKFQNYNPFVDNVTHKLNEVLIENGYAPEWVMLEREIREDKIRIKKKLENCRCKLGPCPLTEKEKHLWTNFLLNLKPAVEDLNKKIDKYNLVVPIMSKQTVHFPFTKVSEKILFEGKKRDLNNKASQERDKILENSQVTSSSKEEFGFKTIISLLKGR